MNVADVLFLYDYNYWATGRILAASAYCTHEQFVRPPAHSFGSLRSTLVHTLDSEYAWRMLCQYQTTAGFEALQDEAFLTFDSMEQPWTSPCF